MKLFDDPATDRKFGRMQWRMLFATMVGYTLFYFMRKNFSFAMPGLQQDCGISKSMLGNFLFWGGMEQTGIPWAWNSATISFSTFVEGTNGSSGSDGS